MEGLDTGSDAALRRQLFRGGCAVSSCTAAASEGETGVWLKLAGRGLKAAQGKVRHSCASTPSQLLPAVRSRIAATSNSKAQ